MRKDQPAEQPPATGATERPPIENILRAAKINRVVFSSNVIAICDYALQLERLAGELAGAAEQTISRVKRNDATINETVIRCDDFKHLYETWKALRAFMQKEKP